MSSRLWIAGGVAAVPMLALGAGAESPAEAFSLGYPFLVLSGGWLWLRGSSDVRGSQGWHVILALVFLVPVVGIRLWTQVMAQDLLQYVAPIDQVRVSVGQAAFAVHGVGFFLVVSGIALGLIVGRRALLLSGMMIGAGLAGAAMELQLRHAALALYERDGTRALDLTWTVNWQGTAGLLLGLGVAAVADRRLGAARLQRSTLEKGGMLGVLAICAWILRPPLGGLLPSIEAPERDGLPVGLPGLSVPLPGLDPWAEGFKARAVERGESKEGATWRCTGRDARRWLDVPRLEVSLAIPADRSVMDLDPVVSSLFEMALHRVALVGKADAGEGPLSEGLAWPAMSMVLEAPPVGSHWIRITEEESEWVWGGAPVGKDAICVLLPSSDLSIASLYARGRELLEKEGCAGLSWVSQPWRESIEGPFDSDPGCREAGPGPGE